MVKRYKSIKLQKLLYKDKISTFPNFGQADYQPFRYLFQLDSKFDQLEFYHKMKLENASRRSLSLHEFGDQHGYLKLSKHIIFMKFWGKYPLKPPKLYGCLGHDYMGGKPPKPP